MSLTAIVNLAERLLNNFSGQSVDPSSAEKQSNETARVDSRARVGDQFTPSSVNQQDAGLFQVKQFSFFSAAAEFLLTQTLPPQANATPSPATAPPTAAPAQNPAQTLVAANPIVAAQFHAVNTALTTGAPAATAAIASAPAATTSAQPANSTQSQLLALNTALYALGRNNTQWAQIDHIASLIQVFNPLAFTSLVYQLQALAQASAGQSAVPFAGTPATVTPAPTATTANAPVTGTAASGATTGNTAGANTAGGFQIQELVIKFSGVQESFTQAGSGPQGGNSSVQLSAFNLQVEEINITLANPAGQSLQISAPQPRAVNLQTPAPATAVAKSAAA
jgi:hypothetical protein